MGIYYDDTYGIKCGYFFDIDGYSIDDHSFIWIYDRPSQEIILKQRDRDYMEKQKDNGWMLTLKLDIILV
jgi:hypothetical protein